MSITFRRANENDFPALLQLFQEFATFEKTPEKMKNTLALMKKEKEHFHGFVAETEQQIIGYVTFFFSYHTWTGKSVYIDDLYVKENFRKKGVGKKLLTSVIDHAKKEQCGRARWQVSNWNTSGQEFYKAMGAQISSGEWNCDLMLS